MDKEEYMAKLVSTVNKELEGICNRLERYSHPSKAKSYLDGRKYQCEYLLGLLQEESCSNCQFFIVGTCRKNAPNSVRGFFRPILKGDGFPAKSPGDRCSDYSKKVVS